LISKVTPVNAYISVHMSVQSISVNLFFLLFYRTPAELFAAHDPSSLDFVSTLKPISATKKQVSIISIIEKFSYGHYQEFAYKS